MSRAPTKLAGGRLNPEKVAYWYFRLNGFLQIENFVVHPERRMDTKAPAKRSPGAGGDRLPSAGPNP